MSLKGVAITLAEERVVNKAAISGFHSEMVRKMDRDSECVASSRVRAGANISALLAGESVS